MKSSFLFIAFVAVLLGACKKETFITGADASLGLSADSLHFDTLFTSTGSTTRFIKIFNENDQKLKISSVQLAGGAASPYKINVDGFTGPSVNDLELEANDSLYVFVTVTINPTAINSAFVVQDSISIQFNGNTRWVQLDAWGQNAHFFRNKVVSGAETWTNDKPYVILGGLRVDTTASLTIEEGCRIYVHADAPLIIDGTLQVNGDHFDSTRVVFRGDRLDLPYREFPASWPGIYFRGMSKNNVLKYASILNAYQGVVAEKPSINANPKLRLSQCIIDNCYDAGIFGVGTNLVADNCLISNCGKNILLVYGGQYNFTHCTSAAYSNNFLLHKEPVLLVTDFIKVDNSIQTANMQASFINCIFWGDNGTVDDEVVTSKQGNTVFNVGFQNCLWKVKANPTNISMSNIVANQAPSFDSINNQKRYYNFRLRDDSPAINKGIVTGLPVDLDGKTRAIGLPDLGAYERQ